MEENSDLKYTYMYIMFKLNIYICRNASLYEPIEKRKRIILYERIRDVPMRLQYFCNIVNVKHRYINGSERFAILKRRYKE